MSDVVTRFAPSPTGHLHVGGARTALFCWAFARRHAGRFMIRIEDTDQARSSEESARGILDDLAWLGIAWDDGPRLGEIGAASRPVGPFFQAQRLEIYHAYTEHLVRCGRAYPAFESAEELDALRRAAVAEKRTFRYPRPADVVPGRFPEHRWARACAGEPHVVRFVVPDEPVTVSDRVLGEVSFAAGELDDFVIRKGDGFPTYHFAVVIDDELMGVTHVLRAQEHLMNTPRHVALQRALTRLPAHADDRGPGAPFRTPVYAHLPLICNMDGSKMSKRDKARAARAAARQAMSRNPLLTVPIVARAAGVSEGDLTRFLEGDSDALEIATALADHFRVPLPEIEVWDYRASGYLPEALVNFLALLGWNPGLKGPDGKDLEKFDAAFLAQHFSLDRIGRTSARFDRVKLLSFNADVIAALSDAEFLERLRRWAGQFDTALRVELDRQPAERLAALARMARPRCRVLRDFAGVVAFALVDDEALAFDAAAMDRHVRPEPGAEVLRAFEAHLSAAPDREPVAPASVEAWVKAWAEARALKLGQVAQPLRVALTGGAVSPPLGEVVAALGRASARRRIARCLERVGVNA